MVERDTRKRHLIDGSMHDEFMAQIGSMEEQAHANMRVQRASLQVAKARAHHQGFDDGLGHLERGNLNTHVVMGLLLHQGYVGL